MLLSTWIISYELSGQYECIPMIVNGERTIESVRLFSNEGISGLSPQYIYVGNTLDFFAGQEGTKGVLLASGQDVIFVNGADVTDVLNDLIVVFDKYRRFEENLKSAALESNPYQSMLDVIHDLYRCPMLFGQKDLHIYALTGQYPESEVYPGWDTIKKYNTIPMTVISTTKAPDMTKYPESIKTVAIPVSPEENKNCSYQIRSNVYCRGELWGHLYIYYKKKSISPAITQIARYCADAYGALLDRIVAEDTSARFKKYTFLADIISGNVVEPENIANLYWQMGWEKGQELKLYKLQFIAEQTNEIFFDYTYKSIEASIRNEIVFPYQNSVIIIAPAGEETDSRMFHTIRQTMKAGDYRCGISYPFRNLMNVAEAYFQADFVAASPYLLRHDKDSFLRYDDYAFAGLISYVQQNMNYRQFVMPELLKLYELDRESGTEYYQTLFWFLVNNGHAANTAKQLYIHRNTLKYRMDRIEEIVKLDLTDHETVAFLRLCYSLLLADYPIGQINSREPGEE
ncbi:MAG: helix-turn-helix domain-containing protein [Oscillospiraceae bacterium]|nr:helix-turn-helix domain-containing protein [Oscillospiraceae bacterium]